MDQYTISKHRNQNYTLFPYTEQKNVEFDIYEKGENVYIYDKNGKKYMDLSSQYFNVNIGYGNEQVIDAVNAQMRKLHYVKPVAASDIRGELCEKIVKEIAPPNMAKIFLTLGGSDANDSAIRIAKAVTGKRKILSQYKSYHGATIGAANLCGDHERIHEKLENKDFIHFIGYNSKDLERYFDNENVYCEFLLNLLEETILYEHPDTIAALFFETISLGNIIVPSKRYYEGVRKLCDKYNILLIFDEVLVGFGRVGKWFACEHYQVYPDIITFAKGVTSSYMPLGGVMVSEQVASRFDNCVFHVAFTASYHPVSCAAAYAAITYMQENEVIKNAEIMGKYLRELMQNKILRHDSVEQIRGLGLLQSIVFRGKMNTRSAAIAFANKMKERGYVVYVDWKAILLAPPLIITREQIEQAVEDIDRLLSELEGEEYLDRLQYYPEESIGYEGYYSIDFMNNFRVLTQNYNKILLLGSANMHVIQLLIANLKQYRKDYKIYLSHNLYEILGTEKENGILFENERFDVDIQKEQIKILREKEGFDCILMPYARTDEQWENIQRVAEQFNSPVFRITKYGEIIRM